MKPILLLNHSFLEGLAHRADENESEARRPLIEVADTVQRARRVRREDAVLHVHPEIRSAEVSAGEPFLRWANQHRRAPSWSDALDLLLRLLSGPFVTGLTVDDGAAPSDTVPSCLGAPAWLVDMLRIAAHHGLSCGRASWILSYGTEPHLCSPRYRAERAEKAIDLLNFRADADAREAEAELSRAEQKTTLAILDGAVLHTERVRVLDSGRNSAKRWELDCDPAVLFDAIRALDAYARALDQGLPQETAAARYKHASSIDISRESTITMKKPSLRKQREFLIPGETEKCPFEMHAKPGSRTRVHIFARREQQAEGSEHTVVYIGHCGEHLDVR